ncbi:uncharacterized protein K452DRAFT_243659 [Aplosporella prunicola CBS 121167]|uniref:mRNA export factor GLE1 n=1 Tax=Aplosporella prunicola CBS 121167 TaxID=1176127 RepID=A0A6A6BSI2_9PEZI|nr:uncharacterized protein K452DRAFT_243659 [Aplosporella prunicola CBS 121167]KAF2145541.1 hypothetical protein K452DRAFT_243659 [Aplosporella prunicola CBS 121167]
MLIDSDRRFHDQLDHATAEQERAHHEALAKAAAEHDRVRQSAERVAEKCRLELERERRRREEESQLEVERMRQENARIEAAEHQRKLDELRRAEEEQRQAAERAKALLEAEERLRAQKAAEEADAARRAAEQAESDRKAKEAAEAAAKARAEEAARRPAAAPAAAAAASTPAPAISNLLNGTTTTAPAQPAAPASTVDSPLVTPQAEKEATHTEYLALHQRLKKFRNDFTKAARSNADPTLKDMSSDMRRQIRTKVGQLTLNPKENRVPLSQIRQIFYKALETPHLGMVDAREYLINQTRAQVPDTHAQAPTLLIFLFSHLAKTLVAQFASEAGVNPKAADPIGIIAVSIFGDRKLCLGPNHDVPFSDILLAKYHRSCGVLFGIYGPDRTQRGRARLGWRQVDGEWITEQANLERMTGLGAGWAALTLRNFRGKEALLHPFPNANFWRAFSRIVNTPPADAQPTHFIVLKAMLEGKSVEKFIGVYGNAAVAALRKALFDFPRGQDNTAAKALGVMAQTVRDEMRVPL